jgi:hypothetical protein
MGVALRRGHPDTEAMNQIHVETARLLTRVVPLVLVDQTFALKGGAIDPAQLHRNLTSTYFPFG